VPDPEIWTMNSKKGWPRIDYDQGIWIPCPDPDDDPKQNERWARLYATAWWEVSGFKYGKKQVRNMEQGLLDIRRGIYDTQPCHTAVIHLPNVDVAPLPVMVATWEAVGDADSQLRVLVRADEPGAVEAPPIEPFTADKLGTGLKSQYLQKFKHGPGLTGVVNYAWRVTELETDVRVFTACGDLGRLQAAMPDIDQLTNMISVEPL
jgi:hypothetical protein